MSYIDYVHVCNTFLVSNNKNISKVKETQDKKLCNLLLKNMGKNSDTCQDPDKVIFNFSSYNLNDHEKLVLCKGLNFAIPPKAIEYSEFLLPFEMLFREITSLDIGDFNKECVKSRLRDSAYSSFKQVSRISDKNLSREEVKALNNFKRKDLYPSGSQPNALYRLSKIHKTLEDGIPSFRPILSAIGTLTYKLAKFCGQLLKPLTNNEYTIKNSFSFAKEVLEFDSSLFMASFDIKPLYKTFTEIKHMLAI